MESSFVFRRKKNCLGFLDVWPEPQEGGGGEGVLWEKGNPTSQEGGLLEEILMNFYL